MIKFILVALLVTIPALKLTDTIQVRIVHKPKVWSITESKRSLECIKANIKIKEDNERLTRDLRSIRLANTKESELKAKLTYAKDYNANSQDVDNLLYWDGQD